MANTRSASKRKRQTEQRTVLNKSVLTGLKGQQKRLTTAIASGDKSKAQVELNILASRLDKAAKRGIVHQNLANRRKSRAAKGVGAVGASKADTGIAEAGVAEAGVG
jgi:small subunit ribosomal protein S20